MDSGEGSRLGALLCLRGARSVGALGAGQDAAGSDDQDVAVGELLLELTGEATESSVNAACRVKNGAYRCWALCQPWRRGTGTKMTMALRPCPTSI